VNRSLHRSLAAIAVAAGVTVGITPAASAEPPGIPTPPEAQSQLTGLTVAAELTFRTSAEGYLSFLQAPSPRRLRVLAGNWFRVRR
jgi:uncharacterized protein with LGFP repeats